MLNRKTPITSNQIAKFAGVSRSTVSKVLNNYPEIPLKTKQNVMKIIEEYGYYSSFSGQALKGKNKKILGYFSYEMGNAAVNLDIITGMMTLGIYNAASRHGYQVYNLPLKSDGSNISAVTETFLQNRIDGAILDARTLVDNLVLELSQRYVIGLIDQSFGTELCKHCAVVNLGEYKSGKKIVEYLYTLGHRSIAVIRNSCAGYSSADRLQGILDGLAEKKLEPYNEISFDTQSYDGYTEMKKILELSSTGNGILPTAIACISDIMAFGAMNAIHEHGLKIPQDISIIGIENHPVSPYMDPPLTSVKQDIVSCINNLVDRVIAQIEEHKPDFGGYEEFPISLVERGSCAEPNF